MTINILWLVPLFIVFWIYTYVLKMNTRDTYFGYARAVTLYYEDYVLTETRTGSLKISHPLEDSEEFYIGGLASEVIKLLRKNNVPLIKED